MLYRDRQGEHLHICTLFQSPIKIIRHLSVFICSVSATPPSEEIKSRLQTSLLRFTARFWSHIAIALKNKQIKVFPFIGDLMLFHKNYLMGNMIKETLQYSQHRLSPCWFRGTSPAPHGLRIPSRRLQPCVPTGFLFHRDLHPLRFHPLSVCSFSTLFSDCCYFRKQIN